MTAPRNAGTLTRSDRALLRWLASELRRRASLPSDHKKPRVRVVMDYEADQLSRICDVLNAAGAATKADGRGVAYRVGRSYVDGGMTPRQAAIAALIDTQTPFPMTPRRPALAAVVALAAELSRKRPKSRST